MAVFISSHILSEVQNLCDRVAFINHGVIKSVEDVRNNSMETDTDIICLRLENSIDLNVLKNLKYVKSAVLLEDGIQIILTSHKTPELIDFLSTNKYKVNEVFKLKKRARTKIYGIS